MNSDNLDFYQLGDLQEWSSLILPRVRREVPRIKDNGETRVDYVPLGNIFVIEPERPNAVWKLAGGHKKTLEKCKPGEDPDRTPLDTAVRELAGETGIILPRTAFMYVGKWLHWRKDHWKILFAADMTEADVPWMHDHHAENEGEKPKFFTREEFYAVVREAKFMREHFEKMLEFALILPGPELETSFAA